MIPSLIVSLTCRRFSQAAPPGYATQVEASNTFAAHARSLVLSLVDQPTVHRAQVLLMLTGHSWGAGEGRRAWVYLGMAVRMAQVLGLFEEPPPATTREDFIDAEERRRTAWTCFLMDSLLSGGKGRDRMLSGDKMRIQLPCAVRKTRWLIAGRVRDGYCPRQSRYRSQQHARR
jgi:hypothetical protein